MSAPPAVCDVSAMASYVVEQELPAVPATVAVARATVDAACRAWRVGGLCDAVVLAVSELVTNVVRSGAGHVTLRLLLSQRQLRLEVSDDQPGVPTIGRPPDDAESGRGLWLVSSVSTRFGVEDAATGKTVWVEFAC